MSEILHQGADGLIREVCQATGLAWFPTSVRANKSLRIREERDGMKRHTSRCEDCGGWHIRDGKRKRSYERSGSA